MNCNMMTSCLLNDRFIYFEGFTIKFIRENDIKRFFEKYGEIRSIQFKYDSKGNLQGSGMLEFQDVKTTQKVLSLSSKIAYCRRIITLDRVRNPGCWFCLNNQNPKGVKIDEVVYEDQYCFVVLDKGAINPRHVLLIPKLHVPSRKSLPLEVDTHLETIKKKIVQIYEEDFKEQCFFFEMFLGNVTTNAAHLIISIIPFSQKEFTLFQDKLQVNNNNSIIENFEKYTELKENDQVRKFLSEKDFYFLFEMSNTQERRINELYAKRWLIVLPESKAKVFPREYGRKIYCEILGLHGKIDWKQCEVLCWTAEKLRSNLRRVFHYEYDMLCNYSIPE